MLAYLDEPVYFSFRSDSYGNKKDNYKRASQLHHRKI